MFNKVIEEEELKDGAHIVVKRGYDRKLRRNVVIKKSKDNVGKKLLLNEISVLKELFHPLIPRLYNYIITNNYIIEELEYIEGLPLTEFRNRISNKLEFFRLAVEILDIVKYIHGKGIVHRDIKPANIVYGEKIGLIDYTVAGRKGHKGIKSFSKGFSPKETLDGIVDEKIDIYSLGATFKYIMGSNLKLSSEYLLVLDLMMKDNLEARPDVDFVYNYFRRNISSMVCYSNKCVLLKNKTKILIGRKPRIKADVSHVLKIDDKYRFLNFEHALIEYKDNIGSIIDLNSVNGTFVYRIEDNVEKVFRVKGRFMLKDGDLILLPFSRVLGPYKVIRYWG